MPKRSAGLLLFRRRGGRPEVLLVHPGGPFWARKDEGAWGLPKGEIGEGEDALTAARREFQEETGFALEPGLSMIALGSFRQSSAKVVEVFAVEGDADPATLVSNTFTMEWPPRSGRMQSFPEADRAAWFALNEAETKIHKGQVPILAALEARLRSDAAGDEPGLRRPPSPRSETRGRG